MEGPGNALEGLMPLVDGNRDLSHELGEDAETLGCHVGDYQWLNVLNPVEDRDYKWGNDTPRDRMLFLQRGGVIVQADDPESMCHMSNLALEAAALDTSQAAAGVFLGYFPMETARRRERERQEQHDKMFKEGQAELGYLERGDPTEGHLASNADRSGLRYMDKRHGTTVGDGKRVVEAWRPSWGIE